MKILKKIILSSEDPKAEDVVWIKPMGEKVVAYIKNNKVWRALGLISDGGTQKMTDDTLLDLDTAVSKANSAVQEIKVNGTAVDPNSDNSVSLTIPSGRATVVAEQPTTEGATAGDVVFCTAASQTDAYPPTGMLLVFNGTAWVDVNGGEPYYPADEETSEEK